MPNFYRIFVGCKMEREYFGAAVGIGNVFSSLIHYSMVLIRGDRVKDSPGVKSRSD